MCAPQYVSGIYFLLNYSRGWLGSSCIESIQYLYYRVYSIDPRPELYEVCGDLVDDIIRVYLSKCIKLIVELITFISIKKVYIISCCVIYVSRYRCIGVLILSLSQRFTTAILHETNNH